MATPDDQIRVIDRVKEECDRHRRDSGSYNDVTERLPGENSEADFYDGFGMNSLASAP